jgi:hypothetical protein
VFGISHPSVTPLLWKEYASHPPLILLVFGGFPLWAGRQKKGGREKLVRVTRAEEIVIYSAKVN